MNERLRDLRLFSLEKTRLQRGLMAPCSLRGTYKIERVFYKGMQ